jgi:hypothetical protein
MTIFTVAFQALDATPHRKPISEPAVWAEVEHGLATEEGRRTGFLLLRYGCQLWASVLEHSSIWRNLKRLLYRY